MRRMAPPPNAILAPWLFPAVVGLLAFFTFTSLLFGSLERPLAVGLQRLLPYCVLLFVAVGIWSLVAARRVLDPSTGAGFAVASMGLLLQLLVVLESVVDLLLRRDGAATHTLRELHVTADLLGTFAYAFGLTMVVVAVVTEIRAARS